MYSCYSRQVCALQGFIVSAHILKCPAPPPDPSCANAPPKIKICQSSKQYQPADITSLSF